MTSPFLNSILPKAQPTQVQNRLPVTAARPTPLTVPVSTQIGTGKKQYNPFLTALNNDSAEFKEVYGVNRPLSKPMFVGYRDDQPILAGGRLFILY